MKTYFKLTLSLVIITFSIVIIFFSYKNIKLDLSIDNLLPKDYYFERSLNLTSKINLSNKVLLFISAPNKHKLEKAIDKTFNILNEYNLELKNVLPTSNDISEILKYCGINSLLLYPYEILENPFSEEKIKKGLKSKYQYIESNPFFFPDDSFFLDPLTMGFELLKYINKGSGKYTPFKNGVISQDGKKYLAIFNANFKNQDYDKIKILFEIDKRLNQTGKINNYTSFLYSAHLYYYDSYKSIRRDVLIIFIFSIIFTFIVFFIFFKRVDLLLYAFLPIFVSFALSFFVISIFKKSYGGIAIAFGGSISGIAIDYTIHYLSKAPLYEDLFFFRKINRLPMFLGYFTTFSSFLIIFLLSNITSLKEIALFAMISITFSFILSFFVLQQLLKPKDLKINYKILNIQISNKFTFILWIIIILIAIIGFIFLKFEDKIVNLDKKHPLLDKKINKIKNAFNESTDSLFLVIENKDKDKDKMIDNSIEILKILHYKNIELNSIYKILFSPSKNLIERRKEFIKKNFDKNLFYSILKDSDFTMDTFEPWINNIKNIDRINLKQLPEYLKNEIDGNFIEWDDNLYLLFFVEDRTKLNNISKILKEKRITHFTLDLLKDSSDGMLKFEKNAIKLIFITFLIIFIIILIFFKNIWSSLLIIIVPLLSLITTFSTAFYSGRGINIMHITGGIIILGISIDYAIYMITSLIKACENIKEIESTKQSILVSALTTIAAIGVLVFSSNQAVFSLGFSIIAGIFSSVFTSFVALPYLFNLFKSKICGSQKKILI